MLIGFSWADAFSVSTLKALGDEPIIFALGNPEPEIYPDMAKNLRPDCIFATSRPEFPNQISSILASPYIYRAVLDTEMKEVTDDLLLAAANAIAELAKEDVQEHIV